MDGTLIHKTTEGRYKEREDWWHLVIDPITGARSVKHTWLHMNTEKLYLTASEGSETTSVLSFFQSSEHEAVMKDLQKLLDEDERT